jgi:hypothetical protein
MAYTEAHGPPALDAFHQWTPAAGVAPPVLNDTQTEPAVFPRTRILRINNWRGLPDVPDNSAPRTTGIGSILYPTRPVDKTIVYENVLEGQDRQDFLLEQNAIVQGFSDTSNAGTMTVTPWPYPGGVVWTFSARVMSLQFDPEWVLDGEREITYTWGYTITLKMPDPRFYTGGTGYY